MATVKLPRVCVLYYKLSMNGPSNSAFHIRVAVRVRPLLTSDYQRISTKNQSQGLASAVHTINDNNSVLVLDPNTSKPTHQYFFDKVFHPEESTEDVYNIVAKQIVYHAVKGYNGTVFAYGQTSSGKTHTVFGHSEANPGIVPMAICDIFDHIEAAGKSRMFFVRLAVLEIYNEQLADLACYDGKQRQGKPLRIRQTRDGFIFVENLIEEVCTTRDGALDFLNECLTRRHMAHTLSNQDSSRSHVICRVTIESRPVDDRDCDTVPTTIGELNFVDLAGSECAVRITNFHPSQSLGANGRLPPETVVRLKEGRAINRSLLMLGIVIGQLCDHKPIVNYRNSKLTRILQNALGGNSLTAIVCTVSPTQADKRQTTSTLQFAHNAKSIKTKPKLNETLDADQAVLRRLQLEIDRLRRRIAELEMQQSFTTSATGSSNSERQHLHENERLLMDMIAGGQKQASGWSTRRQNLPKHSLGISRRMTWAPTGSGHALLMFAGDESVSALQSNQVENDEKIIFRTELEKVASAASTNLDETGIQQESLSVKATTTTPVQESMSATLERIEQEDEFRERYVGRAYFDVVAKNYEKLKAAVENSLNISVTDEGDFSDVADRISILRSQSVQSSQHNSVSNSVFSRACSPLQAGERPRISATLSFGDPEHSVVLTGDATRLNSPFASLGRDVQPARLPPIVVHASLFGRSKTMLDPGVNKHPVPLADISRTTSADPIPSAKRLALPTETTEDNDNEEPLVNGISDDGDASKPSKDNTFSVN